MNIKSVHHKSQHSLHKLPLPQPLILPSDEGERGRGVTARGSDGGREGEMEMEREIEIQKNPTTTCFRDLTFAKRSLLLEIRNVAIQ